MFNTTVLYYTANRVPDNFAANVRKHLLWSSEGRPIISISQRPVDLGMNIHAVGLAPSFYNVYKQILMGAEQAKTKYVACAEDDSLYTPEHFAFEPPEDRFYYNRNAWRMRPKGYYYRRNILMSQCIAPTELMVATLRERFARFKETDPIPGQFGEPGRFEKSMGLPEVGLGMFSTEVATVTIQHRASLSGVRQSNDTLREEMPFWGSSKKLWEDMYEVTLT
jgi:hypothetical protein